METALARGERDPLEIEAFEITPVKAAAAGVEKPLREPNAFGVDDKVKSSDVKGSAASRPPIRWEPASEGESAGGLPTSF